MSGDRECFVHGFFEPETGETCPIARCGRPLVFGGTPVLYADGSGWNGKSSGCCVVNEALEEFYREFVDRYTNNEAEYLGLLEALRMAPRGAVIRLDSQLVVRQVRGEWRVKERTLERWHAEACKLTREHEARLEWVPRKANLAGMAIESRQRERARRRA